MNRTHSIVKDGRRYIWVVARLWKLSSDLPVFDYAIGEFEGFDQDCWYGDVHVPTIRSVLNHVQRMEAANLDFPIILSQSGTVMDGVHRICKAQLAGHMTIRAVKFTVDPAPDAIEPER